MNRHHTAGLLRLGTLCLGTIVLLVIGMLPAEALAATKAERQENKTKPASTAATKSPDGETLEEVLVTAEKRSEGLQNIPIAITAIPAETLEKASVKDVSDLVLVAPSLQYGTRSTNIFIAMRGIGQAGQDIGSQSGVTVALDGVPLLSQFMMNAAFLDLERVEVLRGPQGTIAGRNATGGAINIYAKEPTNETGGDLALTLGDHSRRGIRGAVNGAFSDEVMGRLSFVADNADGWTKNGFLDKRNDDTSLIQVRGQMLFKPTEKFSLRTLAEYTRDKSDPSFAMILGRADPARPTLPETAGYPFPANDPEHLTFYHDQPNNRDLESLRGVLNASWQFDNGATLTSTSGYIKHDIELTNLDVDATPNNSSWFPLIGIHTKQYSQELTLTTNLGERADLVAGLFYMHGDSSEPLYLSLAFGALVLDNYLVYLPEEKIDSYAAYAQFRYTLTDKLRATIGGRYTIDDKSYSMASTTAGISSDHSGDGKFKAGTPRFVLDYTPTDDTLLYVSASRGFKSGGFNTLGDPSLPVNRFDPEYVWSYEAGAKAMLLGRRLRLGLTAFDTNYTNLQQTIFRQNLQTNVYYPRIENSVTAEIKGVEFEAEVAPVTGLRLTAAVTWLDAEYGFFCNNDPLYPGIPTDAACVGATRDGTPLPPGAKSLEGNRLSQAPELQYSVSGQYTFPISANLEVSPRVDFKRQSRVYFDIYNNPQNSQSAYGLLNASLSLGSQSKTWAVTAWIRNANDERYISSANAGSGATPAISGSPGMPRMFGATFNTRF
jgi:iron complex outermembrane recepter protein